MTPSNKETANTILLGTVIDDALFTEHGPVVTIDSPDLRVHAGTPWLADYLKSHCGITLSERRKLKQPDTRFYVPRVLPSGHIGTFGAPGSGKSRFAQHLCGEYLADGCSLVVIDPKKETIRQVVHQARRAGLSKEQITVLLPSQNRIGVPGWNPFLGPAATVRAVASLFVNQAKRLTTSWGPRLQDVLLCAVVIIAILGLSIIELLRFLQRPDYRAALLNRAKHTRAWADFPEQFGYFAYEFASLSPSEQTNVAAPAITRIRALASIPYLRAMLCARRDDLKLHDLFVTQRVIALHLDDFSLGADGAEILAGSLLHHLYHEAMRHSGNRPVVLSLDEMGMQERYTGEIVADILTIGRGCGVRIIAACQTLDQLSDRLSTAVLSMASLRAFFKLGPDDAPRVARFLANRTGAARAARVVIGRERDETYCSYLAIRDDRGRRVAVEPVAWAEFTRNGSNIKALKLLAVASRICRLTLATPTGLRELTGCLVDLPSDCYRFHGPRPLGITVTFPVPRVTVVERETSAKRLGDMEQLLGTLPVQQAIVRLDPGATERVKVVDVAFPESLPDLHHYLGNGQTEDEISGTEVWRRNTIEEVASGRSVAVPRPRPSEEVDRGCL